MRAPEPALSSASGKARLVRAYSRGEPVHCTWQLSPRCESFCHSCDHRAEASAEARAEIESLYTVSGFLGGLRTLVTG